MQPTTMKVEKEKLADTLAECFSNETSAKQLLTKAGFRPSDFPPFGNPTIGKWWGHVCEEIERGKVDNYGLEDLSKIAAIDYPGNAVFKSFRAINQTIQEIGGIFLSYSKHDRQAVDELFLALQRQNPQLDIFQDYRSISPGKDWLDVIKTKAGDSSLMVCWVTDNYLKAQFCHYEFGIAESRGAKIISVLIDDRIVSRLPAYLTRLQAITLRTPVDYNALAKTLIDVR